MTTNGEAPTANGGEPGMGYCYRIPGCGCVVAAQVDEPEYKREVAKFKRHQSKAGFVLDHLTIEEIRALPWGWPCEHMKRAASGIAEGRA